MAIPETTVIQLRRGTAEALAAVNETPKAGEPILDTTNNVIKYGDGVTAYNDLPAAGGGGLTDEEKAELVTKTELSTDLSEYTKTADLPDVSDMLTKTEAGTTYASKTDIADMETKTDAAATYATKEEIPDVPPLEEFVKVSELAELDIANLPTKEEMSDFRMDLSDYAKISELTELTLDENTLNALGGLVARIEAIEARFGEINGGTVNG